MMKITDTTAKIVAQGQLRPVIGIINGGTPNVICVNHAENTLLLGLIDTAIYQNGYTTRFSVEL